MQSRYWCWLVVGFLAGTGCGADAKERLWIELNVREVNENREYSLRVLESGNFRVRDGHPDSDPLWTGDDYVCLRSDHLDREGVLAAEDKRWLEEELSTERLEALRHEALPEGSASFAVWDPERGFCGVHVNHFRLIVRRGGGPKFDASFWPEDLSESNRGLFDRLISIHARAVGSE